MYCRSFVLFIFLWPLLRQGHCQSGVTLNQLPSNYQLFARDSTNKATVSIEGVATTTGTDRVSVRVLREGQPWTWKTTTLGLSRPSSFTVGVQIQAGKFQYTVRVYAHKGADSVLIAERTRIVCGDYIQIYGQSNAIGFYPDYPLDDTYLRNFDFVEGTSPTSGQVTWYPSKKPYAAVGLIGWRLQELILQQFGIPTCIINGAAGGAGIEQLSNRNAANPADLNTNYGQTLYRHQMAKTVLSVRAIIWKQGETEAGGAYQNGVYYSQMFDKLYKQWRQDYGAKPPIYLSQVNYLPVNNGGAGSLRDFQRRTKSLYTNLETIATVGTPGFDGIHYATEGNLRITYELFRQMARDLYKATDTVQINSPSIQKAYYNVSRDTLTMVFEPTMQMVWPADTTLNDINTGMPYQRKLKDFIYLDGLSGLIRHGSASQNRVILALTNPVSATSLTYLPAYLVDEHTSYYDGVHLKNGRGMRAFTFENVRIATGLPIVAITSANVLANNQVRLSWQASSVQLDGYAIERASTPNGPFVLMGRTTGQATSYLDATLPHQQTVVYYRLRASSTVSESPVSAAVRVETANLELVDLQLSMRTSVRVPAIDTPFLVTLTLTNNGPATATQAVVENRLPPNLVFLASNATTHSAGVVTASVASLSSGQSISWTYVASVQQPGNYILAAQVLQCAQQDADSQPGSGTSDGEDDMVLADLRTTPIAANTVFASPNPNPRALPVVLPNQPAAVTGKADVSLRMQSSTLAPAFNDLVSFTVIVANAGAEQASTLTILDQLPPELAIVDANGWQVAGNQLSILLTNLVSGESRSFVFTTRVIGSGYLVNQAQISQATPADPDSTPGNGFVNGEDDTAQVALRIR
jgi:uncharacterized repeat protein (TIGR01451 family)